MSKVPVTYLCYLPEDEKFRRHILNDLSAAGVSNIVLAEKLLEQIVKDFGFADVFFLSFSHMIHPYDSIRKPERLPFVFSSQIASTTIPSVSYSTEITLAVL